MKYCALSEKGKRKHNEDSFFIPKHSEVALAAVADGMGGHKAGSTASSLALDVMVKDICRGGERRYRRWATGEDVFSSLGAFF